MRARGADFGGVIAETPGSAGIPGGVVVTERAVERGWALGETGAEGGLARLGAWLGCVRAGERAVAPEGEEAFEAGTGAGDAFPAVVEVRGLGGGAGRNSGDVGPEAGEDEGDDGAN